MNHNFVAVAADTDGLAFRKADGSKFSDEERQSLVGELNSIMDELVRWEDDGVFKCQLVIAAKNYVLQDMKGKIKIKGASLKATTKEKALQKFTRELIDLLLAGKKDRIFHLYLDCAQQILDISDITEWCMKKSITKAVLDPTRTQEQKVLDALAGWSYSEGDKVYMFALNSEELCLRERFTGQYCVDTLLKKLHGTLEIFGSVIDTDLFPDFTLERNKDLLGLETKKQKKQRLALVPPMNVKVTR